MSDDDSRISIDDLAIYAKKKGFVYPSEDIYGGLAGFYDYGPFGVELKNNIRQHWWKTFVKDRDDVLGMDGSIISSRKVWDASGHLSNFADLLCECEKCKKSHRADHLVEDKLGINVEGLGSDALNKLILDNKLKCPDCGGDLKEIKSFNLMFPVNLGADTTKDSGAFLRGETAQLIFVAYKNIMDTARVKLPFGIAQTGKAFRNEISPRNFLFRTREFEQMEIEYFIHPESDECPLLGKRHKDLEFLFYSAEDQEKGLDHKRVKMSELLSKKKIGRWHAYWLAESYLWYAELGVNGSRLRIREHTKKELSHYSKATFDVEYEYPFGWKEIHGNADRGQFDLGEHQKHSAKKLEMFDEATKKSVLPKVIEPSFGLDRAFLTILYDAYHDDKERGNVLLKLDPKIAPFTIAVFPLVNKLDEQALEIYLLLKKEFTSMYDRSGSIGRRYARADELGIPYTITIDFDTLEDKSVTIRDRDSTKQIRVKIEDLRAKIVDLLSGGKFV